MSARRPRLPKDVAAIFGDAILPEEVAGQCSSHRVSLLAEDAPAGGPPQQDLHACAAGLGADPAIERLMETVVCRRDYVCCRPGLETPCRARPLLGGRMVECLQSRSHCGHRSPFLHKILCTCAIRHRLIRRLGR
jgi:hypothetical protein